MNHPTPISVVTVSHKLQSQTITLPIISLYLLISAQPLHILSNRALQVSPFPIFSWRREGCLQTGKSPRHALDILQPIHAQVDSISLSILKVGLLELCRDLFMFLIKASIFDMSSLFTLHSPIIERESPSIMASDHLPSLHVCNAQ